MDILNNTWFYSLSALAQVMATEIALFGVFAIFKLDKITKDIDDFRGRLIRFIVTARRNMPSGSTGTDGQDYYLKNTDELIEEFKSISNAQMSMSVNGDSVDKRTVEVLKKYNINKKLILNKTKISLILSVVAITISFVFLLLSEQIFKCNPILWLSFAVTFSLFALSYTVYAIFYIMNQN